MKKLDYIGFAELIGTTEDVFLNQAKRYEAKAVKLGYKFEKVGKGKKALYQVQEREIEHITVPERLEKAFGFKPKHPYAMWSYIFYLMDYENAKFMTDPEIAKNAKIAVTAVAICRHELIDNGFMVPIEDQNMARYYKHVGGKKIAIPYDKYSYYYKQFYFPVLRGYDLACQLNKEDGKDEVWKHLHIEAHKSLQEAVGGTLSKTKAREFTPKFIDIKKKI